MSQQVGNLLLMVPVAIVAVLAVFAVYLGLRKRYRPLQVIGSNLETLAGKIESDLTALQLEDSYGLVSQGWNRLITEVQQARRELETHQVRQQTLETIGRYQFNWTTELLNKMSHGLMMVDQDLTVTFVNASAERLLGQNKDELLRRKITEIFDESLGCIASPAGANWDRRFDFDSGGPSVHIKAVRIQGQGGDGQTALFLQDMSQQKEAERARDQFLYHITHELRTPLTNIRAYAETLSEGVLQDRDSLRECYNVIVSETDRLSRLVEDILNVSQLEAGSARLQMDEVQTARLIRQVVEDMQAAADEKNVELILSLPPKVPRIRGDKERLAVVLTNLVGNAIKYTPNNGQVEVGCVEEGTRVRITVRDTGIGIAPEEQGRVFDKFYRANDERVAQLPGTGLGLAIARETVRSHGGIIELESEPGKGSTFSVVLPIGKTAAIKAMGDE